MNLVYVTNYLILSIALTLFMLQVGFAIISLLDYEEYKDKISDIVGPLWEVVGTFAVFYIVNFEISYPKILGIVGTIYVLPLLLAGVFIVLSNGSIIFSEYIGDPSLRRRFRFVYSISLLLGAMVGTSILTSGLSGFGINMANYSLTPGFIFNGFNILAMLSLLMLSFAIANAIVKPDRLYKIGIGSQVLGLIIGLAALYIYGFRGSLLIIVTAAILLAMLAFAQIKRIKYAGLFSIFFMIVLINLLGTMIYPYILGNLNVNDYTATSSIANAEILITAIGGSIIAASLAIFVYFNYIKKVDRKSIGGYAKKKKQ